MLLMVLRVAYLLICAGAILAYITSDADREDGGMAAVSIGGHRIVRSFRVLGS